MPCLEKKLNIEIMENLRNLSDIELAQIANLMSDITSLINNHDEVSLPASITNTISTFELKLEKELTRREL